MEDLLDIETGDNNMGVLIDRVVTLVTPALVTLPTWQSGAYPLASWLCCQPLPAQKQCFAELAAKLRIDGVDGVAQGTQTWEDVVRARTDTAKLLVRWRRKKVPRFVAPLVGLLDGSALAKVCWETL